MPSGLCECGCGELAPIAGKTQRDRGNVKGQPRRFIFGHRARLPRNKKSLEQRFWDKVRKAGDGCWTWMGSKSQDGYGHIRLASGKTGISHRASYELHKGEIPDGLQLDHLCRTRDCVNPDHLEAVTPKENNNRGFAPSMIISRSGFCKRGHEKNKDTHYMAKDGVLHCRVCARIRYKERRKAQSAQGRT